MVNTKITVYHPLILDTHMDRRQMNMDLRQYQANTGHRYPVNMGHHQAAMVHHLHHHRHRMVHRFRHHRHLRRHHTVRQRQPMVRHHHLAAIIMGHPHLFNDQ